MIFNRKRENGFGLVEVLIAILLSAVVMLGSVVVSTRALRVVRENEVRDTSSSILLRSLEIARSPVDFNISEAQGTATQRFYRLNFTPDGALQLEPATGAVGEIADCQPNSFYRVEIDDPGTFICNQVVVRRLDSDTDFRENFEIKSIVVYDYIGRQEVNELISYRQETN